MGKRGPQPQPTALKLARGNPGKRPINDAEPELDPAGTEPPKDLAGRALAFWQEQAPGLILAGVLTTGDVSGFATLCRLVAQEAALDEAVAFLTPRACIEEGVYRTLHSTRDQKLRYLQHFGLTPSSRSGIKAKKPATEADQRRQKFGLIGGGPA
jgi:phage terminase small subunit